MADNKYTKAIADIRKGIADIISEMTAADDKINEIATSAAKLGKSFKVTAPDGINESLREQTFLLKLLSTQLDKQKKNTDDLANAKKRLIVLTGQENINNRELAKNADLYARANSKLVGTFGNLEAKRLIAKKTLRDLIAAEKQNVTAIKAAQREYDKLSDRVNKANAAVSNFSKGGIGRAIVGFRQLLGAFGIAGAIQMFARFTVSVFDTARKLESLSFAMKATIKSSEELGQTQVFLQETAKNYGLDLVTLTERYIKFRAAAEQSNISARTTMEIFDSFAEVSGVLGLAQDETNGVFLALEQMLSKGKVTTEELRRQLGERLPGAFGIMAQTLKVSIALLDEMLKKGEVLSAETLPEFAKQVQKAFGLDTIDKVDTLNSAFQNLSTSWANFVETISKNSVVFKSLANLGIQTLDAWGWIFTDKETIFEKMNISLNMQGGKDAIKELNDEIKRTGESSDVVLKKLIAAGNETQNQIKQRIEKLKADRKNLSIFDLDDNMEQIKALSQLLELGAGRMTALTTEQDRLNNAQKESISTGRTYQDVLDDISDLQDKLKNSTAETRADILLQIDALEREAEGWKKNKEAIQKFDAVRKGSLGFIENLISKYEDEQKKIATTSDEYADLEIKIRDARKELEKLKAAFEFASIQKIPLNELFDFNVDELELNDAIRNLFKISDEGLKSEFDKVVERGQEAVKRLAEIKEIADKDQLRAEEQKQAKIDLLVKTTFDTFADQYNIDLSKFEFLYDNKENTVVQWASAVNNIIDSALDASLNRYDIELQAAQRSRDLILQNDLATDEQKRLATKKFEQEERKIKTKRAKQERENTIIKIAVDTASAVAAALAPPPLGFGPAIGLGFIPLIAGLGLAQAALVASQPIPKFKEGTKTPLAKDTLSIVGDGGRKEAITEKGKLVGITPDRPTFMMLKKGQEVQKDADTWIHDTIYNMNAASNGEMMSSLVIDNMLYSELKKMREDSKKTWDEVKKLASRNINVVNKVSVEQPYRKYNV